MAAAVVIEIPISVALKSEVGDIVGNAFTDSEYRELLARYTERTGLLTGHPYIYFSTGSGWYVGQGTLYLSGVTMTDGADDHIYLNYATGSVRALTARRALRSATANSDATANLATVLTDSGATFTTGTAVAPGDLVILTLTGAMARVLTVDSATQLTTEPLDQSAQYTAGQPYVIGTPPGTDTLVSHTVYGRRVDWKGLLIGLYQTWLRQRSLQATTTVGSATMSPETTVNAIRQRVEELRGVIGGPR